MDIWHHLQCLQVGVFVYKCLQLGPMKYSLPGSFFVPVELVTSQVARATTQARRRSVVRTRPSSLAIALRSVVVDGRLERFYSKEIYQTRHSAETEVVGWAGASAPLCCRIITSEDGGGAVEYFSRWRSKMLKLTKNLQLHPPSLPKTPHWDSKKTSNYIPKCIPSLNIGGTIPSLSRFRHLWVGITTTLCCGEVGTITVGEAINKNNRFNITVSRNKNVLLQGLHIGMGWLCQFPSMSKLVEAREVAYWISIVPSLDLPYVVSLEPSRHLYI